MHRTPPRGHEQSDDTHISDSHKGHGSSTAPRQRQMYYYHDEHPEIPRIRRASLHPAETPVPSSAPTKAKRKRTQASRQPATPPKVKLAPPEKIVHDAAPETPRPAHTSARTPALPPARRHLAEYDTPAARPHSTTARRRQPRSLLTILQDLSHNRALMLLGMILLIVLIITPLAISIAHQNHNNDTFPATTPGGSQAANSGNASLPAGVHELVITPRDTDHPAPPVLATSAYLLDADTGATLYAHNPFMHLPMLSTTKLMTAVLAVEMGNPDQRITITSAIYHDISQLSADSSLMGIKKGETYTLRDLLYGLLLPSGNDAAVAIADALAGNQQNFVAKMNQEARALGMYDTHYMNPHGLLQTGHYSSAHDLALLGRYSMSIPLIHQISATKQYHITKDAEHAEHYLVNGNQFLWWYPGVDGGKPGWDGDRDFIQVVSCVRNHHHLIGVTMNTVDWWTDMRDLMNWGFDTFTWVSPYNADITNPPIPYDYEWDYFVKDKQTNTIATADHGRYYIYTGYSISGPIMAFFDKGGGLKKFGYPTGMPRITTGALASQQFQHGVIQCDTQTKACSIA